MKSAHVNRHVASCAAVLVLALCSLGQSAAACVQKPTTHTVTIDATRFEPAVLTVTAGDIVVWIDNDIISHTATSQTGLFDSGSLVQGQSFKIHATTEWGIAYVCTFHPNDAGHTTREVNRRLAAADCPRPPQSFWIQRVTSSTPGVEAAMQITDVLSTAIDEQLRHPGA